MNEIARCPNKECHDSPMAVIEHVTHNLFGKKVACLRCWYGGPVAKTAEEAIRLHNAICAALDDGKQASDEAKILAAKLEVERKFSADLSKRIRELERQLEAPDDGKGQLRKRIEAIRITARFAREHGHHEIAACYEYCVSVFAKMIADSDEEFAAMLESDRWRGTVQIPAPQGWQQGAAREIAAEIMQHFRTLPIGCLRTDHTPCVEAILKRHQEGTK